MSDHFSGPRAMVDPATDLTDLYAFPSPSRLGRLVFVMDVFPSARPGALFSDAASCRFRIRSVTIPASGPGSRFDVGTDEYAITCAFAAPAPDDRGQSVQEAMCTHPNGAAVFFRLNDKQGGHAHGVRVFAGLRMDPNFSYLEIEQAPLRGRAHETCGGRSLNNDAIDTMATLVYTGGNGPRISDGVDQQTVRASQSFPYLAPPNPNPPGVRPAMLPAKVADQLALIQEANSAPATR